jgi:hypothetical protein
MASEYRGVKKFGDKSSKQIWAIQVQNIRDELILLPPFEYRNRGVEPRDISTLPWDGDESITFRPAERA